MKLVFTAAEVAEALQLSLPEFQNLRPKLEHLGFPRPVSGLEERWAIMPVINWLHGGQDDALDWRKDIAMREPARLS
jgi:hypothetical protein